MDVKAMFVLRIVVLLSFILIAGAAKRKAVVNFTKFKLENYQPDLLQINYILNRTSDNVSSIYANFNLTEDVNSATGSLNIGSKYAGHYFNHSTVDLDCNGLGGIYGHYVVQTIVVSLRSFSNIPVSCPFKKNTYYYVNGFKVLTDAIPSYLPEMSFDTDFRLSVKKRPLIRIITTGQLQRN